MNIEFRIFKSPAGGEAILPPQWRTDQQIKKLTAQKEAAKSEAERTVIDQIIAGTHELVASLAGVPHETKSFTITPYTRGVRRQAQQNATSWASGAPRLDGEAYDTALVAAATGLTEKEVDELSPALFDALSAEVRQLCEPSIDQIRFFDSSPTN